VGRKVGLRRAQCAAWTRYSIMQIITITQIIAIAYYKIRHCPWDAMTDASRCNPLRVSAQKGGGTSSFQRILAHSAFLCQLDVYARPYASDR